MIDKINIRGYRSLKDFHMEGCSRFNILVGPNNTGKSSLLEALFLHCAPANASIIFSILTSRGGSFRLSPEHIVYHTKWLFSAPLHSDDVPTLTISSQWKNYNRKTTLSLIPGAIEVDHLAPQSISGGTHGTSGVTPIVLPPMNLRKKNEPVLILGTIKSSFESDNQNLVEDILEVISGEMKIEGPRIKTDIPASLVHQTSHKEPGIVDISQATLGNLFEKAMVLLRDIDPDIEDIRILSLGGDVPEVFVKSRKIGSAPFNILGDGLKRISHIAFRLSHSQNGILLIDEFENSIDKNALRLTTDWIFRAAKKNNTQIFLTTHSLECLDTILETKSFVAKDFSLFRMRREQNDVFCKRIPGDKVKDIRFELGQEIRWS